MASIYQSALQAIDWKAKTIPVPGTNEFLPKLIHYALFLSFIEVTANDQIAPIDQS